MESTLTKAPDWFTLPRETTEKAPDWFTVDEKPYVYGGAGSINAAPVIESLRKPRSLSVPYDQYSPAFPITDSFRAEMEALPADSPERAEMASILAPIEAAKAQHEADLREAERSELTPTQLSASKQPTQEFISKIPILLREPVMGALGGVGKPARNLIATAVGNREEADRVNRVWEFQEGLNRKASREGNLADVIGPRMAENVGMVANIVGTIAASPVKSIKGLAGLYALSTADSSYTQAKDAGLSTAKSVAYATGMGAIEAALMLSFAKFGGRFGVKIAEQAILTKGAARSAAEAVKNTLLTSMFESSEEGATAIAQKAWGALLGAEDTSDPWKTASDVFRAMEVGALGGAGAHTIGAVGRRISPQLPGVGNLTPEWIEKNLTALQSIVSKNESGKGVSRGDLEKAGIPTGGTTTESRAEIAEAVSEALAAKPGETASIATQRRVTKESDWEAKAYEGRKPLDSDYTPERGRSWLADAVGRSPSDTWSAVDVADWIRRSHPDFKYWRHLKDTGQTLPEAVSSILSEQPSRAELANRALAGEEEPLPDLSGPRTDRPPLSQEESNRVFAQIDRMQQRGEIAEDSAATLKRLPRTTAADIISEAEVRAQADRERADLLAEEYRTLIGTGRSASALSGEANLRERAGSDLDKTTGLDQLVEAVRSGQYPLLAGEASARGQGDIESGLADIVRGGAGQFAPPSAESYVDDLVAEYQSAAPVEQAPPKKTFKKRPQETTSKPLAEEVTGSPEVAAPTTVVAPAAVVSEIEADIAKISEVYGAPFELSEAATESDREAAEFLRSLGKKAVFVRGDRRFRGATGSASDTIYLTSGSDSLWDTVGHELAHSTQFDKVSEADADLIDEYAQRRLERASPAYRERMERSPGAMRREGVAELIGEMFHDPAFRERVRNNNPTLWQRIREVVVRLFSKYDPKDAAAKEFLEYIKNNPGRRVPVDGSVLFSEEDPYGIANALTDARRAALGLPERLQPTAETWKQWNDAASAAFKADPDIGRKVAEEVLSRATAGSAGEETAILNQYTMKVDQEMEDQILSGAKPEEVLNRDEATVAFEADAAIGTSHAIGLSSRNMRINRDFSLSAMVGRMRRAKGGGPLTAAESEQITDVHSKGKAAAQAKRDSLTSGVRDALQRTLPGLAKKGAKSLPAVTEADLERVATDLDSPHSAQALSDIARRLAKEAISSGIEDAPSVVNYVHKRLSEHMRISSLEVSAAIARYGQYKPLSTDAVATRLRDISAVLLQTSKLADIWSGRAPKRTGFGKRERTDYERKLVRMVNDERKKYGIESVDPETQLKSALDSIKTRLKNQIADLNQAIRTRSRIVKNKRLLEYDDEANQLKADRDALQAQYNEVFDTEGLTDEQRRQRALKLLSRSVAEYDRRIAERDFSESGPESSAWDPEISIMHARRDARQKQYEELKALDPKVKATRESREAHELARRLARKREELLRKSAAKEFSRDQRPKKEYRLTPEQKAVIESYEKAKAEFNVGVTRAHLTAEYNNLRDKLSKSELPEVKERAKRPLPADVEALKHDIGVMKNLARQAREHEERRRSMHIAEKAVNWMLEPWRFARTMMYGGDIAQIGRHGKYAFGRPQIVVEAVKEMAKSIKSQEDYDRIHNEIYLHPLRMVAEKAGLDLTSVHGPIHKIEELFHSELGKRTPGLKQLGRGYTTYLNLIRFRMFAEMYSKLDEPTEQDAKSIAGLANVLTGRGQLGERYGRGAAMLSDFFSAPRFQISRAQILTLYPVLWNPDFWRSSRQAKAIVAKEFGRSLAAVGAYYGMLGAAASMYAYVSDDDEGLPVINLNPFSWMFGTVRFGDVYHDPAAGVKQYAVMASKIAKSSLSNSPHSPWQTSAERDSAKFVRGRLSPLPSHIWDFVSQRTYDRDRPDLKHYLKSFLPLGVKEGIENMQEHGWQKSAATTLANFIGEGSIIAPGTEVLDPWGRYMPGVQEFYNISESQLTYKLTKADMLLEDWNERNPDEPIFIKRIENRYTEDGEEKKFEPEAYFRYQKLAGDMAHSVAEGYAAEISSPTQQQATEIREIVNDARGIAREVIKGQLEGSNPAGVLGGMKREMGMMRFRKRKGESDEKFQRYRSGFARKMALINAGLELVD